MDNNRKLITGEETAKILGIEAANGVLYHLEKGHIEGVLVPWKTRKQYMYYEDTVYGYKDIRDGKSSAYGNLDIEFGEMCKPLLSIRNQTPYAPFYYPQKQYLVTSYGNVWDLSNNKKVPTFVSGHGHMQINILFRGETIPVRLHRIVAMMFCQNGRFKNAVHHIDCNGKNNHADNLLWVTSPEHGMLHSIWNKCKDKNDFDDYYQAIEEIREDNIIRQPYRYIEESVGDNGMIFLVVTEDAYKRIAEGASTDTLTDYEILSECYLNIPQALKQECSV